MTLPARQQHGNESQYPPFNASVDPDSEAMPPPQYLPNSQDSQSTASSTRSLPTAAASFPNSTHAQKADQVEHSPPSSFIQVQSSQSSALHSHRTLPPLRPYSPNSATEWRTKPGESGASSPSSGASASPTHGSKRTASGAVKMPELTSPTTSAKPRIGPGYHSRNTSVNSNASSVSELSAQLKTRLTYAMAKVQNGRENSLAEVENSVSQISSPISPSAPSLTMQSPRASLANASRRSRELTQAVGNQTQYPIAQPEPGLSTQSLHSRQPSSLTESYDQARPRSNGVLALAPAPELKPASRDRRINGFRDAPPPSLIKSQPPTYARAPATPTPQEQDAVDTLLFMSSPANSTHFPHHRAGASSSLSSPHRSGHPAPWSLLTHAVTNGTTTPVLTNQTDMSSSDGSGDGHTAPGKVTHPATKRRSLGVAFKTEQDVDRLLDQMAEIHSSDEDEVEIPGRPTSATARQLPHPNGVPVNVRV